MILNVFFCHLEGAERLRDRFAAAYREMRFLKNNMSKKEYKFYVYIVASASGTIYIGVTNNLVRRISEHKEGIIKGFTEKYACSRLIYYECFKYISEAVTREKELKKWNRKKKENLIKTLNSHWDDLFETLF